MSRIAITGGSGMLGRALLSRLTSEGHDVTTFSRSEKTQLALRRAYPSVRFLLGDVSDPDFLALALEDSDAVIHAAALKHVDLSESEPAAYVETNVVGSLLVAKMATHFGVRAVGVSTDKACEPRNVYGLTKLLMERVFSERGHVCVRYGNVFGSDGSVLETWGRQLEETGTISVTDPSMLRFFFPVEAAVEEVLWSLRQPEGGVVVVPRLRSTRIADLAVSYLEAVGRSGTDVRVIGPRPGEKRHESLLSAREAAWCHERDGRAVFRPGVEGPGVEPIDTRTAEPIPGSVLVEWVRGILDLEAAA